jgi:hypothetical protein
MRVQRCINFECRRPFQVNEFSGKKSGAEEPVEIVCPHCGHTETQSGECVYVVHALSPEQEADFNANNPH